MKKIKFIVTLITLFLLFCGVLLAQNDNTQNNKPETATQNNNTQYNKLRQRSLISDFKAFGIGDAVKVIIVESTEAGNSAGTSESRNSGIGVEAGVGYGATSLGADASLSTNNSFKGDGANTRKESIRSQLTAKVDSIDERGNYHIIAKRITSVDGEEQTIELTGFIRPSDISSNNSVYSYNIMDLKLYVKGEGNFSKMQKPGLFTKFFRMLF